MTTIRLTKNTEDKLEKLSKITHRSKSFYVKEALKRYLEDIEDYYLALERLSNTKAKYYSSNEAKKRLEI